MIFLLMESLVEIQIGRLIHEMRFIIVLKEVISQES